jgi:hypothetical protein
MNDRLRKRAAMAVVMIGTLLSGAALGQDPGACHEAYLQSGLTEQQLSFDDFRSSYHDTLCAPDGLSATHGARVHGETR